MNEKILIIEDETKIARVLQLELEHEGYAAAAVHNGLEGLERALAEDWQLIVLDVMLPGLDGLEVLRRLRQSDCIVPVILLTARGATPDIVSGFHQGANDYVVKPFVTEELLARIRNLLLMVSRQEEQKELLEAGDLTVDIKGRRVTRDGSCIDLTPKEFELLHYLLAHKNEPVSREQLITDVWGYDFVGDTNIVDVYIRYLRQKIDQGRQPKLIRTVRGVGYELAEPRA